MRTFVGRDAELHRVMELLDAETLFLVYGVGGIGKSEFVYKVFEEARERPAWRQAEPVLLQARPGVSVEHLLTMLRVGAGARPPRVELQSASVASFEDELAEAARVLEARATLVFLDDVHHLDPGRLSSALGYLSRHVRKSRLFVASRLEVPLPPAAPAPVVTRLSPLDAGATAAMVSHLTRTLGIESPSPDEVFQRSGGSPFFVQRELASAGPGVAEDGSPDSSLDRSLRELEPRARRLLLVAGVMRGRTDPAELAEAAEIDEVKDVVRELARRFLIDTSRGVVMVHDLIRDALARQTDDRELCEAHRRAARLHQGRYRADPARAALDAVEAVHHLIRAGDVADAWRLVEDGYRTISAAGLDYLLVDDLRALRAALPRQRTPIDLMWARVLVRRSLIADAQQVLRRVSRRGAGPHRLRYLLLEGEVAQRLGRLRRAEELFAGARELCTDPADRFAVSLRLADVGSLRGRNHQARALLVAAQGEHPDATDRERGRWGWSLALSYVIEERCGDGIAAARRAAEELGPAHADLIVLLAMLEIVAHAECDEIEEARRLLDQVVSRAAHAGALREHMVAVYSGIVLHAEGDLRGARVALESSFTHLSEHFDSVMASIAGYYLGATLLAQGEIAAAVEMSARMTDLAEQAGLETLAPHGVATLAEATLAAGDVPGARKLADRALTAPGCQGLARWLAECVLIRADALEGELPAARARLEAALAAAPAGEGGRYLAAAALERAAIEMMGGDPDRVVEAAEQARAHYLERGRRFLEARACVALAAGRVARGRPVDLVAAEEPLARAETLCAAHDYPRVAARCALVRAALSRRADDGSTARVHLVSALRELDAAAARPEIAALRVALQRDDEAAAAGVRASVALLGLAAGPRFRIVDRTREYLAAEDELERERAARDLVVEPARAVICAGGVSDRGRPVACELLARIIEGQGAVVGAEELFRDVWDGREYHPLRHRNTVYVGVKRLRATLRRLLGDREVIETAPGGWRLADGVDAALVRPAD